MLRICTFNIKNDYVIYNKKKAFDIAKLLRKKRIDILCFQELFSKCYSDLKDILSKTDYKFYGDYRYKFKLFDIINESVAILTNKKVIDTNTYKLPIFPSILNRIVTRVTIDTEEFGTITILNTHLDYKYDVVKKRQLKTILELIKKEINPIILTGDFNLKNNNPIFNEFTREVEKIGLKRVKINEKTLKHKKSESAIDHIFISEKFILKKLEIIKDLEISDHYPVLIEVERNI